MGAKAKEVIELVGGLIGISDNDIDTAKESLDGLVSYGKKTWYPEFKKGGKGTKVRLFNKHHEDFRCFHATTFTVVKLGEKTVHVKEFYREESEDKKVDGATVHQIPKKKLKPVSVFFNKAYQEGKSAMQNTKKPTKKGNSGGWGLSLLLP